MHVLFAGGGTAGHINPALAVASALCAKDPKMQISYIGTKKGLESRLVPEAGYAFYTIDVAGFQRRLSFQSIKRNLSAVGKVFSASHDAKRLLKDLKPDVVVGTGGYVSGPVLREAVKLGLPTLIHEQNAFPGVTTKMLAPKVDRVLLAMPKAEQYIKSRTKPSVVGNPVRSALLAVAKPQARQTLGIPADCPVLLSFGGSLGARPINEAVAGLMAMRPGQPPYYHIHATGKSGYQSTLEQLKHASVQPDGDRLRVREYIDDMDLCLAAADLVVCRAGAITLSELAVCGKPSILIPSPYVAENHQYHNAMSLKEVGAAEVIEEKDLTPERLAAAVERLLFDPAALKKMSQKALAAAFPNAAERIAADVLQLADGAHSVQCGAK